MTCTAPNGIAALLCLRSILAALMLATAAFALPHGAIATKGWVAGTLNVEAQHYSWGQLISLKGAVENGDPFRATRIMVAAGQHPDFTVWRPSLNGVATGEYLGF